MSLFCCFSFFSFFCNQEAELGSLSGRPASCSSAAGEEAPFPHSWVLWGPPRRAHIDNDCLVMGLAEGRPQLCHFVKRQLHISWPFLSGEGGRGVRSSLSFQLHQNSWHIALFLKVRSDSTSGVKHLYLMLATNFNELDQWWWREE